MNWQPVAAYLEGFSEKSTSDADSFERRYGPDPAYQDQIQRKRIVAEIALMLAYALQCGDAR